MDDNSSADADELKRRLDEAADSFTIGADGELKFHLPSMINDANSDDGRV